MKKRIICLVTVLTLLVACLFGCTNTPEHFKGKWNFSQITKVDFTTNLSQAEMDFLKETYESQTEEQVLTTALSRLTSEQTYINYYVNFAGKDTYTYVPVMDREATWVFYQTSETTGFISFDANLDVNQGNPDPAVFPEIRYDASTDSLYVVELYGYFMVTIKLAR